MSFDFNLPKNVLNSVLGESFDDDGPKVYTLKNELDYLGEKLIFADYTAEENHLGEVQLLDFIGWTENYILLLTDSGLGDRILKRVPRNPPN